MKVIRDDLWLCVDCLMFAVNGDLSGIDDDARAKEVEEGVASLGPHLVPDFDSDTGEGREEFAWKACDGCQKGNGKHKRIGGEYHRFSVLGEDDGLPPEVASALVDDPDYVPVRCGACGEIGHVSTDHANFD